MPLVVTSALFWSARASVRDSVPALIVVAPLKVLARLSVSVPARVLVRVPVPLINPKSVPWVTAPAELTAKAELLRIGVAITPPASSWSVPAVMVVAPV